MEINYNQVQKILDSCPIGYYLNTNEINVELVKDDATCYNNTTNTIKISYPLIEEQLTRAEEYGLDLETITRTLLYHELSHAILTPQYLMSYAHGYGSDLINWVEDERIERILANYYMNTNFKANIKCAIDINKLDLSNPDIFKGESGFALCVRFGIGIPQAVEDLEGILKKYENLVGTKTPYYRLADGKEHHISEYPKDVRDFYNKYFATSSQSPSQEQLQQMLQQLKDLLENEEKQQQQAQGEGQGQPQEEQEGEGKEQSQEEGENLQPQNYGMGKTREDIQQLIGSVLATGFDGKLYQQLLAIFERTNIVEKMTSGASSGYSGVFNPRNCVRKDYKYFIHQDHKGDAKGFSKLHLNLFIDVSGSFYRNEDTTNRLLTCLTKIEKSNPNFSFDLVTLNHQAVLRPKDKRYISCDGGNRLPLYLKDLYYKMYKHDAVNYNLILFDGDCLCNSYGADLTKELKNFITLFDNKNTTIISEWSNEKYFKRMQTAQVIYCSNYVEQLTDKVTEVLKIAFGN